MIYGVVAALIIIILTQLLLADRLDTRHRKYADELSARWDIEREAWKTERQQLLDRIQAPSFDHLKQAEVRIIKAHNNEKEPPKLEQL